MRYCHGGIRRCEARSHALSSSSARSNRLYASHTDQSSCARPRGRRGPSDGWRPAAGRTTATGSRSSAVEAGPAQRRRHVRRHRAPRAQRERRIGGLGGMTGRAHAATPIATTRPRPDAASIRAALTAAPSFRTSWPRATPLGLAGRCDVQIEPAGVRHDGVGLIDGHRDSALAERPASRSRTSPRQPSRPRLTRHPPLLPAAPGWMCDAVSAVPAGKAGRVHRHVECGRGGVPLRPW
jgi:hypothetical protein